MEKKEKKAKEHFDEAIDKLKEVGDDIRDEIKDQDGIAVKGAAASLAVFPKETRKNLVESQKSFVKAVKSVTEDYLEGLDNLLKEVS